MDGFVDIFAGAVVASSAAFFLFKRLYRSIVRDFEISQLEKDERLAGQSFRYLETLCRELANHMMTRDSGFYLKTYEKWQEERKRIGELSESEMQDRLRVISSEIPRYEDLMPWRYAAQTA
ncbi:hypothetical protein [Pararhizobium sp. IMCC21322]|uniref:hypothetical protein n=1 Tax=Pararhizobium sp. IMCC21322 TaxID=3067903 RepID=UPI002741F505|nr:hypothetical protein [Pararhizobium sp. IMCC21322]